MTTLIAVCTSEGCGTGGSMLTLGAASSGEVSDASR